MKDEVVLLLTIYMYIYIYIFGDKHIVFNHSNKNNFLKNNLE